MEESGVQGTHKGHLYREGDGEEKTEGRACADLCL